MEKPFDIIFDFPVAHSDIAIALRATAELHHSEPYYVVHTFRYAGNGAGNQQISILPAQEIKMVKKGKRQFWVHRDSERESLLSTAIGKEIEKTVG